jgi:carbon monoxide dehydrogenase subunit G
MTRVEVAATVEVAAPAAHVWAHVTDWPRHADWVPLTRVETVDGDARQLGGRIRTWTGIGPLGFSDPLTVTAWEEQPGGGGRCVLEHTGRVVKGDAQITVTALGEQRSQVTWTERLELGPLTGVTRVGAPVIRRALARVLAAMASSAERER